MTATRRLGAILAVDCRRLLTPDGRGRRGRVREHCEGSLSDNVQRE